MRTHSLSIWSALVLFTGCAAETAEEASGTPVTSEAQPLYRLEIAPNHTVDFYDLGNGARMYIESGDPGTELLTAPTTSEFAVVYRQAQPHGEIPAVLLQADAKLPPAALAPKAPTNGEREVSLVTQAASTDEWRKKTGGCACPLGDVVHKYCKTGRTGNWSDTQTAEYAWWNINHISGNGMDVFTNCDGKGTKVRWEPGRVGRLGCTGPRFLDLFDIEDVEMRLAINGAADDTMDLSACWSIFS